MSLQRIVFLGPQRLARTLRTAIDQTLGDANGTVSAPLAAVTAGWEEREPEDEELRAHVGGELRNLAVWRRCEEIYAKDRELFTALSERHDTLRKLQEFYRVELSRALDAARELLGRETEKRYEPYLEAARESAIASVRLLDLHHLERVRDVQTEFQERWNPAERQHVARHRREVAEELDGVAALCIAGGHVAILLNRLRLCGVLDAAAKLPIFAWSAGAMVLGERIVLFHDSPPQGPGDAEVLDAGLEITHGIVPLPHAKRRLRIDDVARVALFARRFGPDQCVALNENSRLDWDGKGWTLAAGTERLTPAGQVTAGSVA